MRVTQVKRPVPDTGCVQDGVEPTGFVEAPHRFLARRPESYFAQLYGECLADQPAIEEPEEGNSAAEWWAEEERRRQEEYCRNATMPAEAQGAGELSAFEEGLLIEELRAVARVARDDLAKALA